MQALYSTKGKSGTFTICNVEKNEIRRKRLRQLVEEFGPSGLAKLANRAPSYITVMLYPPDKKGAKNIGERTAEVLENAGGKPRGWLSSLDSDKLAAYAAEIAERIITADDILEQWSKLNPERQRRLLANAWDFVQSQAHEPQTSRNPFATIPAPLPPAPPQKKKVTR